MHPTQTRAYTLIYRAVVLLEERSCVARLALLTSCCEVVVQTIENNFGSLLRTRMCIVRPKAAAARLGIEPHQRIETRVITQERLQCTAQCHCGFVMPLVYERLLKW